MINNSHLSDVTICEYLRKMGIRSSDVNEITIDNDYHLIVKFNPHPEKFAGSEFKVKEDDDEKTEKITNGRIHMG